ncbi:MAG: hypothetical protein KF690_01930 [Bacteroidetes bacterium]|nr:hypothetical protein [Bacteroidota bacterium]
MSRWPLLLIALGVLAGWRPQDGQGTPPAYRSFNQALDLLAQDSLSAAAQRLQALLPGLPPEQRAVGHNNLAYMLLRQVSAQSNPEETRRLEQQAYAHLRRALSLNPDNEVARYNYELLMQRMQQPPPQTPPPPNPEDQPPPPPRNSRIPNEASGQRMTYEPQDEATIQFYLKQMRQQPVQYFHQARKSISGQRTGLDDRQPW